MSENIVTNKRKNDGISLQLSKKTRVAEGTIYFTYYKKFVILLIFKILQVALEGSEISSSAVDEEESTAR